MKKDPNKYPRGLTAAKVKAIIDYYENLSDADLAEEIEHAPVVKGITWMQVPMELVPKVEQLIARHKRSA